MVTTWRAFGKHRVTKESSMQRVARVNGERPPDAPEGDAVGRREWFVEKQHGEQKLERRRQELNETHRGEAQIANAVREQDERDGRNDARQKQERGRRRVSAE